MESNINQKITELLKLSDWLSPIPHIAIWYSLDFWLEYHLPNKINHIKICEDLNLQQIVLTLITYVIEILSFYELKRMP